MFGEKTKERYKGKEIAVWQMPKYKESKEAALKIIKDYEGISEGDFWILKNYMKGSDQMGYSGLIISHNGCLKLNDTLPPEKRFSPKCVSVDKDGYNNSLVFTYCSEEQGIYEVGEFSRDNSSQAYPYAMAYKRMFDRVVLKMTKLAYGGIYSEVEADEFREHVENTGAPNNGAPDSEHAPDLATEEDQNKFNRYYAKCKEEGWVSASRAKILQQAGYKKGDAITTELLGKATVILMEAEHEARH